MKSTGFLATVIGLITVADAHMEVTYPPPFRSKYNSFTTDIDYDMTNPLSGSGSNFPCKGYHNLWDTAQGRSVATWTAGQTYNFTLAGSATHNGGSCQVSLSYDRGKTFRVIQSYIGNCPLVNSWKFTLPNDTPSGDVLWSWSWFNQIGNREMYNNCARITIKARSLKEREVDEQEAAAKRSPSDPFSSRPTWFVANVGNGCSTVEGKDVQFPKPGPDVAYASTKGTTAPVGSCGSSKRALPLRV